LIYPNKMCNFLQWDSAAFSAIILYNCWKDRAFPSRRKTNGLHCHFVTWYCI